MFGLRLPELLLILLVVVLLFGAKKLPELGDSLGKGIRAFKKSSERAFDEEQSGGAQRQGELPHGSATNAPPPVPSEKTEKKV